MVRCTVTTMSITETSEPGIGGRFGWRLFSADLRRIGSLDEPLGAALCRCLKPRFRFGTVWAIILSSIFDNYFFGIGEGIVRIGSRNQFPTPPAFSIYSYFSSLATPLAAARIPWLCIFCRIERHHVSEPWHLPTYVRDDFQEWILYTELVLVHSNTGISLLASSMADSTWNCRHILA